MTDPPRPLIRKELSFLPNLRAIRLFEKLFELGDRTNSGLDRSGNVAKTVPDSYISDSSVVQHVDVASIVATPGGKTWWSDSSGVFAAGDPSEDIVFTVYDVDGAIVGTGTVTSMLASAAGTVTVTTGASTGITTTVSYTNNTSTAVLITVKATLSSGKVVSGTASTAALDLSGSGSAPVTGGGK